ncbi:sulfite exporter TauE/SafE family protein [Vibrio sp. FNV 38]|nr:sulfite exporter TauE/SafE family protein [Vibrio sp. FNV 38]
MEEIIIVSTLVIAGFIRGYTGFGFSAIVILVLSSLYPVSEMVPAVLLLDLIVSLPLVASAWNKADFKLLTPILWATLIGVPFGYVALIYLPDNLLKVLVPSAILGLAVLSNAKTGISFRLSRSPLLCGFMSGWTTSAVSSGGAPVVIYMRCSNLPIEAQRNGLICYFFITACFVVGSGFVITQEFQLLPNYPIGYTVTALAALMVGKWVFNTIKIKSLHHIAFYLMLTLSALTLFRAIWML